MTLFRQYNWSAGETTDGGFSHRRRQRKLTGDNQKPIAVMGANLDSVTIVDSDEKKRKWWCVFNIALVAQCHQAYFKVSILILFRVCDTGVGGSSQGAKKLI
ncbi:hypothetical protein H5410_053243 [Solanum commersonii]|uniref:Uncharacterized protein n=1 Tax=Solanum commersonii TaxID=4109 RepID=A0A9J5X6I3_SOLCO|nr:hypothetical protein H5410_053243 [Solanum commersonii]